MKQKRNIKIPVYKFSDMNEILKIIKSIQNVEDFDKKTRFYLVVLGYRSIDIQNFKLQDAEELIKNENVPKKIRQAVVDSLERRKISIESNNLKNDLDYLFVNSENKHIHDCILLREWREFIKSVGLEDVNIHVFKQSISYMKYLEKYKHLEMSYTNIRHSFAESEEKYVK